MVFADYLLQNKIFGKYTEVVIIDLDMNVLKQDTIANLANST